MTIKERFKRHELFEVRQRAATLEREQLKAKLAAKHSLKRNVKFDYAWNIAWANGHACGLAEVESLFDELVPLLKP